MRLSGNRLFEHQPGAVRETPTAAWESTLTAFFARGNRIRINGSVIDAAVLTAVLAATDRSAALTAAVHQRVDLDDLLLFVDDLLESQADATRCDFTFSNAQATAAGLIGGGTYRGMITFDAAPRTGGALQPPSPPTLRNARFSADAALQRVLTARTSLSLGARGPHVLALRQALADIGFARPTTDTVFDAELAAAVSRFQREAGLPIDGLVGPSTLRLLDRVAPPPGEALQTSPEYDRLFADNQVNIMLAIGHTEEGDQPASRDGMVASLQRQGFTEGPVENGLRVFTLVQEGVTFTVRLLYADDLPAATARATFTEAMQSSEVVIYEGHARYGTGPDFDDIARGSGNFAINPLGNGHTPESIRRSLAGRAPDTLPLHALPYQLLFMYACTTEDYLANLRNPRIFPGRTPINTDIVYSTCELMADTAAYQVNRTIEALLQRRSFTDLRADLNLDEHRSSRQAESDNAFSSSGLLGNP